MVNFMKWFQLENKIILIIQIGAHLTDVRNVSYSIYHNIEKDIGIFLA